MMGWQWHQLDYMQIVCTLLQTDNHASTSPLSFIGRMPFQPSNERFQSIEGTTWRYCKCHIVLLAYILNQMS